MILFDFYRTLVMKNHDKSIESDPIDPMLMTNQSSLTPLIQGWFDDPANRVELVQFSDGTGRDKMIGGSYTLSANDCEWRKAA